MSLAIITKSNPTISVVSLQNDSTTPLKKNTERVNESNNTISSLSSTQSQSVVVVYNTIVNQVEMNEEQDPFLNLPANWIQLPFQRKKSCLLTTSHTTCVTKAINYLEALQNCIEKW
jgi:hypothetical protein